MGNKFRFRSEFAATLLGLWLTSGCDQNKPPVVPATSTTPATPAGPAAPAPAVATEVVVDEAPPPPIAETMSVSPDPTFVWVPGGYLWENRRWRWEPGHWVRPPRPGAVWIPHQYQHRDGRHV